MLHGPCADGGPPRPGGGRGSHPRHRHGRAGGGPADAGSPEAPASDHARGGQGLRRRGLRGGVAVAAGEPACGRRRGGVEDGPGGKTALDGRTTRPAGYAVSLRCRKRIEAAFGWIKAQAGLRKVKLRGRAKGEALFTIAAAAYSSSACPSSWHRRPPDRARPPSVRRRGPPDRPTLAGRTRPNDENQLWPPATPRLLQQPANARDQPSEQARLATDGSYEPSSKPNALN